MGEITFIYCAIYHHMLLFLESKIAKWSLNSQTYQMMIFSILVFSSIYRNYHRYKFFDPSKEQVQYLQDNHDIWGSDKTGIDVFMSSTDFESLGLSADGYNIINIDIQSKIDEESSRMQRCKQIKKIEAPLQLEGRSSLQNVKWFEDFFHDFSTYTEMHTWYVELSRKYPHLVRFIPSIGKSIENRDIFAIHITAPNKEKKKQFYLESLIHAREWATGTTTTYIAWKLVEEYTKDNKEFAGILERAEFIFVPIANPDGYEYTHNSDRMWRKNRRKVNDKYHGVDLNRNWNDGYFGQGDSSDNPKSQMYRGKYAFSEPETKSISQYYKKLCCVVGAIDFHSYSQWILKPSVDTSPNDDDFTRVTMQMSDTIMDLTGMYYDPAFVTKGSASNYFYVANPKKEWVFSLTIEVRPGEDTE